MTDTPIQPPRNWWRSVAWFIGEVARPYSLISVATATSWAIFDGKDAAVITAAGLILAAMYGAKAIENGFQSKDAAKVEIAKAQTPSA
jgi:hypothetical protein